jgi:hypothetical protein
MNSRERLMKVLKGEIPDHVPVAPDTSNMIPAKLTGKPFWDLYLYKDPPIWKAYLDCVKHFGFDSLMDGYVQIEFDDLTFEKDDREWENVVIFKNEERIITQKYYKESSRKIWSDKVDVYYRADPPTMGLNPSLIGLPAVPDWYEPVVGIKEWPKGEELLKLVKDEMGDHGLVGVWCGTTKIVNSE